MDPKMEPIGKNQQNSGQKNIQPTMGGTTDETDDQFNTGE